MNSNKWNQGIAVVLFRHWQSREKVRKCWTSWRLEPFTSCWSLYQLTYCVDAFRRALSNLIIIKGSLKCFKAHRKKEKVMAMWWGFFSNSFLGWYYLVLSVQSSGQTLLCSPRWNACQARSAFTQAPTWDESSWRHARSTKPLREGIPQDKPFPPLAQFSEEDQSI